MKQIQKLSYIILIIILFGSCSEYLDVNTDPNNPTTVTPDLVLPVGQYYSAYILQRDRGINHIGNMFMYNWSQSDGFSWYEDEFLYQVTTTFYEQIFEYTYSSALKQYQILDDLEDTKFDNYKAIGQIMKAFHFQLLVDIYGNIPYSEALQRSGLATPKYDDAKTVYEGLITDLTNAISLIENADAVAEVPGDDDAMFGGDMNEWKKFANSVKLRILVRQMSMSGRDAYLTQEFAVINAQGSGYITDNVGINPGFIDKETGKQNIMWDQFGQDASGSDKLTGQATCATDYIISYLQSKNDPRINSLYEVPDDGHLGVPQGLTNYDVIPDQYDKSKVSNIGDGVLKSSTMDAIIYTMAECNFNLAEAALKGFVTSGTAKSFYEAGINASFDYLGTANASNYYGQTAENVGYDNSTDKLEAIITQKWIAVNGITAEQSWFDYSRTGFPTNLPISLKATSADRPVRLYYPASEISSNGGNVPSQPDAFSAKIFWAK